jgi:hypothetical protein
MTKPPEKTTSTAPRPIAPPPLSQHLRKLASRPERALGAVFGDPSRLYEYDPDDPASSRRQR